MHAGMQKLTHLAVIKTNLLENVYASFSFSCILRVSPVVQVRNQTPDQSVRWNALGGSSLPAGVVQQIRFVFLSEQGPFWLGLLPHGVYSGNPIGIFQKTTSLLSFLFVG